MSKAIFLGSFNPPHIGHLNCVQSVIDSGIMKQLNIDKIHVIPCWQNPNKVAYNTTFNDRYKMCNLTFMNLINDGYAIVDDIEQIIKPKYTYQLIEYFNSNNDDFINNGFWWIITVETFIELLAGKWKNSDELLYDNNFILLYNNERQILGLKHNFFDMCIKPVKLNEYINAHSTNIRDNFYVNAKYDSFLNKDVVDYINENNLYK